MQVIIKYTKISRFSQSPGQVSVKRLHSIKVGNDQKGWGTYESCEVKVEEI